SRFSISVVLANMPTERRAQEGGSRTGAGIRPPQPPEALCRQHALCGHLHVERHMPKTVQRKPQKVTVDELLDYEETGMPEKMELIGGVIGPFSDRGKLTLLANW